MEGPSISVIIPHLNQPVALEACLSSLEAQSEPRNGFEIIVVDNGSTVPPHAIIERHPGTRLLRQLKPGPGHARNTGAEGATADILAFIDADCRAHPDWLRAASKALCSFPKRTILGGDVRIWRDNTAKFTAVEAYESVFAYRFKLYLERHGFCGTGNLILQRRDFYDIGGFAGIEIAEDMEWGSRARAAGYSFRFIPEMVVFHPARRSLRELCTKWDRHIQHYWNMTDKDLPSQLRWIGRAFLVLISPFFDWVQVMGSDRIHGASARIKAILVLLAIRVYRAGRMIAVQFRAKEAVVWNRGTQIGLTENEISDIPPNSGKR